VRKGGRPVRDRLLVLGLQRREPAIILSIYLCKEDARIEETRLVGTGGAPAASSREPLHIPHQQEVLTVPYAPLKPASFFSVEGN
jgi:hypothetical protein